MDEQEIRDLFKRLDANGDGSIEEAELIAGLKLLHLPTDPVCRDISHFFVIRTVSDDVCRRS